jgi:hypothetical protein
MQVGSVVTPGTTAQYGIVEYGSLWMLTYNGTAIGYWPQSTFTSSFTYTPSVQIYAEVAGSSAGNSTTQMGSGVFPGTTGAAFIYGTQYVNLFGTENMPCFDSGGNPFVYYYEDCSPSTGSASVGGPGF